MNPPAIGSVWWRYDGAILVVQDVHGRDVFMRVKARPTHGNSRLRRKTRIVQHVLSDFNDELGNTFMRRLPNT